MSSLTIFHDSCPEAPLFTSDNPTVISKTLKEAGILFEQWPTQPSIGVHSSFDEILVAYDSEIQRIVKIGGYQSWDVVALNPDNPNKAILRQKFLDEHTHGEDEVRFFVSGQGLFTLHIKDKVYNVLCQRGDFISVPAKIPHWFDMGTEPHFIAIRLFNNPDGWVATYTGSDIANSFPRLEEVCCV
ncbi:MAG: acireductone dioxygenase [Candidatus Berkiella sp.]